MASHYNCSTSTTAHHRVGQWSDANVKLPSPQTDVQAEIQTDHVPNITCATQNAKTMRTVTLKMLMAMMKLMGCKPMKFLFCNLQKYQSECPYHLFQTEIYNTFL